MSSSELEKREIPDLFVQTRVASPSRKFGESAGRVFDFFRIIAAFLGRAVVQIDTRLEPPPDFGPSSADSSSPSW